MTIKIINIGAHSQCKDHKSSNTLEPFFSALNHLEVLFSEFVQSRMKEESQWTMQQIYKY